MTNEDVVAVVVIDSGYSKRDDKSWHWALIEQTLVAQNESHVVAMPTRKNVSKRYRIAPTKQIYLYPAL